MTIREPRWTPDDRDWALAFQAEQSERCAGCGQPLAECMDSATAQTWRVLRMTCEACRVIEAEQENDAEAAKTAGGRARGRKYGIRRTS